MAGRARPDEIRAQQAVNRAMNGELVELRSYALIHNNESYRIGVPPEIPRNTPVGKGDETSVFVDFASGVAVYDFGGAIGGDDGE